MCVCAAVCLSPFHVVDFEAYLVPTSQSQMYKVFRDSESLEKSAGKKWSQNIFVMKWSKIAALKKVCFLLILPNKTWWKPSFPMDKRPLVEGYISNFGISLNILEFFRFGLFFQFLIFFLVFVYSWSTLLWYQCYYPHRSRDFMSPVRGIFSFNFHKIFFHLIPVS